jgi:hypothetical protein
MVFENGLPPDDFLIRNGFNDIGVGYNFHGALLAYVMYYTYRPSL